MVVVVLFNEGDQLPLIPFVEVVGSGAIVAPLQIAGMLAKFGLVAWFTTIVIDVVSAHGPDGLGVKTYVVVVELLRAGDQVPEKPLLDVVGSGFNKSPVQIGAILVKIGSGKVGVV